MKKISVSFFFILYLIQLSAQNHYTRFESIDVQNYIFDIHLNDSTNRIEGKTTIKIRFLKPAQKVVLDLVGRNDSTNAGMEVSNVSINGVPLKFSHQNNQLDIYFSQPFKAGEIAEFEVEYAGIPADGLIISKNKFGDRTFFGDNWPDHARYWLPTVDHPSDKATLEFRVTAPEKYQVVSNGIQLEESNLENHEKLTVWKENIPISTKIMVIGVARFAVLNNEKFNEIPVSSWVFPQNRENGFLDYSVGDKPLKYFTKMIGPYSYEKLAHVQSNTRYGGMENAGCIFYAENSVTGKNRAEGLIAHETAHQWFGNSVTEQNWHHVWLSEGFATYLTHLYNRHFFGEEVFKQGLIKDREMVIRYAKRKLAPIIDTTITNYNQLLNTNTYQKAGWLLHMLHENIGDSLFIKSLQEYYRIFKDSTALTADFQKIAKTVSGQNLEHFFYQWLYQPGFPKLKTEWKQRKNMEFNLEISQVQKDYLFTFPLEIEIQFSNGNKIVKTLEINDWKSEFKIPVNEKVESIQFDPSVKLLFEGVQ
jgi:aminopeptidase N